jgi:hypothetical protein
VAQKNEVLCKVLAHNVCVCIAEWYGLGIEPDFGTGCTLTQEAAHLLPFRRA